MRNVELIDFRGELVCTLSIPETPNEVQFKQLVNYTKAIAKFEEHPKDNPTEYLRLLVNCLAEFFEIDIEKLYEVSYDLDDGQAIDMETGLVGLHNHIQRICRYEPVLRDEHTHRFEFKGRKFLIPHNRGSAYVKGIVGRADLTVGEAIEAMEIDRVKSLTMDDDPDGSEWYTRTLGIIASLVREEGVEPATTLPDLIQRNTELTHFFADIDLVTALDISFFLKTTTGISRKIRRSPGSLIPPRPILRTKSTAKQ